MRPARLTADVAHAPTRPAGRERVGDRLTAFPLTDCQITRLLRAGRRGAQRTALAMTRARASTKEDTGAAQKIKGREDLGARQAETEVQQSLAPAAAVSLPSVAVPLRPREGADHQRSPTPLTVVTAFVRSRGLSRFEPRRAEIGPPIVQTCW